MKIYSKINKNVLLHIINRVEDINKVRNNIIPENEFLQLSSMKLKNKSTFKAHYHVEKDGEEKVIAQESWVIISGLVKFIAYDLDKTIIGEYILKPGDCSITLRGGHNYEALEDNTLVYEYKTGPYKGMLLDKKLIDEQ